MNVRESLQAAKAQGLSEDDCRKNMAQALHLGGFVSLNASLPKGYSARTMWLYVAPQSPRKKWRLMASDMSGFSVTIYRNSKDKISSRYDNRDVFEFDTKRQANTWAECNGLKLLDYKKLNHLHFAVSNNISNIEVCARD